MHEKLDMKSVRWIQIAQKIDLHLRGSARVMNLGPLWRAPSLSLLCSVKRMSTIIYHGWNSYTIRVGLVNSLRSSALSHCKKKRVQDSSSYSKVCLFCVLLWGSYCILNVIWKISNKHNRSKGKKFGKCCRFVQVGVFNLQLVNPDLFFLDCCYSTQSELPNVVIVVVNV